MKFKNTLTRCMQHKFLVLAAATTIGAMGMPAAQAAYPEHPINMVVSYGPGGGTDLVARAMAPYIEKYLGNDARIVVLNRPGAGGEIGFAEIARAKPDGYTIGFLNTPNLLTIPIQRKTQYHWTDFDLLGNLIDDPDSFAFNTTKHDFKSLDDLAKFAKAHPGEVTVGTTGKGSDDHLAMLAFQNAAGVEMLHVPYKGAGPVRTAISGGEIVLAAMNIGEVKAYIAGGSPMKSLGVMSAEPSEIAPELPTFKEQGYDIIMSSLRGIGAPKGLPEDIRNKLVEAVRQATADPEFRKTAQKMFVPLRYLGPDEYKAELAANEVMFKKVWEDTPWSD
ncbi:tripartite tricarboxylate transporter substrate binding protein [Pusillimonas harenae]|uniref:Tripartite tricarboxylate transporter substrate binding protein n=2 Tax=Pollutimonas harenae TaxID=657015 RepID=A0A853GZK0_9BURK|nr:tripartite tricarboxylate transporter substrate binding protein [Pollutimonas harenae]NYT84839.1 tripartite tricarboxylate transporter substrate binding protein [Pollutimonas harenae]TEA72763.1 tripartite tricarboxylate transporter substrate binding protein [Pollutimonas harenae]